jgi:long-subunit acyl-CoA synthetase (AMP-forming)
MQETSGSTGKPKLALWRQDRLYAEIKQWIESANLKPEDRYLDIHTMVIVLVILPKKLLMDIFCRWDERAMFW